MAAALDLLVWQKAEAERTARALRWPSPRYQSDAVGFCLDVCGFAPTRKQVEVLEAAEAHDRVAIPKGRKTGGSRIMAAVALRHFCSHDDATVVLVAPSERQITEVVWFDIVGLYQASGRCIVCKARDPRGSGACPHSSPIDGELSASVRSGLRSGRRRIIGIAPRNAEHARGISGPNQLWIIDEASGVSREIYTAADGNRAAGAKLIVGGQPTSRATWFYDACERLGFETVRMASTDSPNVVLGRRVVPGLADRTWIKEKLDDWGGEDDPRYQVEVLGMFPTRESVRLVTDEELGRCFERYEAIGEKLDAVEGELYVGIDPAGGRGQDKSAIVVRRGSVVLDRRVFDGATDRIVGELDVLLRRWRKGAPPEPVTINFDASSSFGADLHHALRLRRASDEWLRLVALEMRGNPHMDPILREARCARLVDAYFLNLSIRLRSDAAIPYDENLRTEALFAEWREDQESGTKLISKREYRKALGRSPDLLDATAFAFWEGRVAPASVASANYRAGPLTVEAPTPREDVDAYEITDRMMRGGDDGDAYAWEDAFRGRRR